MEWNLDGSYAWNHEYNLLLKYISTSKDEPLQDNILKVLKIIKGKGKPRSFEVVRSIIFLTSVNSLTYICPSNAKLNELKHIIFRT